MSDIPKTLQEIYISVLVHDNMIRFDGRRVYEYKGPRSFLEKLKVLNPKVSKIYILVPTGKRMKHARPNLDKARMDKRFSEFNVPQCRYLYCGRNIEFGYNYCEEHGSMLLCSICTKRESVISINCKEYCSDCTR
jgi:hypothetical protein